jgi:hypothetical protein
MDEILKRIAYYHYELCKNEGFGEDSTRDWRYAEKALNHLLKSVDYASYIWRADEDEYGECRTFLNESK